MESADLVAFNNTEGNVHNRKGLPGHAAQLFALLDAPPAASARSLVMHCTEDRVISNPSNCTPTQPAFTTAVRSLCSSKDRLFDTQRAAPPIQRSAKAKGTNTTAGVAAMEIKQLQENGIHNQINVYNSNTSRVGVD
eukprot:6280024-Amphidinium_carterae.1